MSELCNEMNSLAFDYDIKKLAAHEKSRRNEKLMKKLRILKHNCKSCVLKLTKRIIK